MAVPSTSSGGSRWILIVLGIAAVGGGAFYMNSKRPKDGAAGGSAPSASASAAASRPVPVVIAEVQKTDFPIYLEGLGNVTPLKSVTVRTVVDGHLDAVYFKEGQTVHKGDLLAQVDPRPYAIQLQTAQAALAKDKAQARNSKLDLDRYTELRKGSLVAQQQVDSQQTTVDQANASVSGDEAAINAARLNLEYSRITSPIEGVTGIRLVDPGNMVHAADPGGIVLITQLDPIAVIFTLPEDNLVQVSRVLAAKLPVVTEAWSRDGSTKLATGELQLIDNQIDPATATIKLKATFKNTDKSLWPNQFVKVRLLVETRKDALTVPAAVIQRGPKGTFAYVADAENSVKSREITVDLLQGDTAIISKGLSADETVVVDGQNQLRDGAKVAPRTAADEGARANESAHAPAVGSVRPASSAPKSGGGR